MTYSVTMRSVTTPYVSGDRAEEPFTLQQMTPPRRAKWPLFAAAGALSLAVAGGGVWWATRDDTPVPAQDPTAGVVADCREQARAKLKSPSTAQFPGGEKTVQTGNTMQITGPVDAQNSFGAMLRIGFRCVATRDGDSWSVYSVEVTG